MQSLSSENLSKVGVSFYPPNFKTVPKIIFVRYYINKFVTTKNGHNNIQTDMSTGNTHEHSKHFLFNQYLICHPAQGSSCGGLRRAAEPTTDLGSPALGNNFSAGTRHSECNNMPFCQK